MNENLIMTPEGHDSCPSWDSKHPRQYCSYYFVAIFSMTERELGRGVTLSVRDRLSFLFKKFLSVFVAGSNSGDLRIPQLELADQASGTAVTFIIIES